MFISVVTHQCGADRLEGGMAAHITVGCQHVRIALACDNGADDPHSGCAGNVRDNVMKLQIHLHQGFLHVLDMRGCVFHEPLPLT
jgi:hypothetical protein